VDDHPLQPSVQLLFRSALLIFLVTIVIGILNGLDIWDPTHETGASPTSTQGHSAG
jgi:hypothetical protein